MPLFSTGQQWTVIAEDGSAAINFHSFVNIDVTVENPVTQAPIELGGFVDYNRVISPTTVGLMLSIQGTPAELQSAIAQIDRLVSSCSLVSVLTPYAEFRNFAIEKYQYSQENTSGVDVLYFNFSFKEIREVGTQYSNARVSSQQKRGQQQTQEASILSGLITGE